MDLFKEAFCVALEQSLGETPKECKESLQKGFISSISVNQDGENFELYLVASLSFLEYMACTLLMEDDPQEDVLIDLSKEVSNLVAGVAKARASDQRLVFKMSTPKFIKIGNFELKHKGWCSFSCGGKPDQKCTIYRGV